MMTLLNDVDFYHMKFININGFCGGKRNGGRRDREREKRWFLSIALDI